jgi:hypothetical protein
MDDDYFIEEEFIFPEEGGVIGGLSALLDGTRIGGEGRQRG